MVDAVLLRYAHERKIEPTGPEAPRTVTDAVRDLVQLPGASTGILAEVDDERALTAFASEHLVIGVTGGSRRTEDLCFSFIDRGEGQHPSDFERTFLSLSERYKSDIPFVQGKYNMGSSGVLSYCGTQWYKLIVSRRYDESGQWGWTLVRQRPSGDTPVAEYLVLDQAIPTFSAAAIQPMMLRGAGPDPEVTLSFGTIVKLYSYTLEARADTSFDGIRRAINANLVSTILPFRLRAYFGAPRTERAGPRGRGVDVRPLNGLEFQLRRHERQSRGSANGGPAVQAKEHISTIRQPDLGHIEIEVIRQDPKVPSWLGSDRVLHCVNGQVQFKQNRAFLSRQCGLPGLKDRIVVIVDASRLTTSAHNSVWKGDRERVLETTVGQRYLSEVREAIRESDFLKELQQILAAEEIAAASSRPESDLLQSVIDADPNIAQLLPDGTLVRRKGKRSPTEFMGSDSPSFVELRSRSLRENGVDISGAAERRIDFVTDAENGWLTRDRNKGSVKLSGKGEEHLGMRATLHNGRLRVKLNLMKGTIEPGQSLDLALLLEDENTVLPIRGEFRLNAVESRLVMPSGGRGQKAGGGAIGEGDEEVDTRGVPRSQWMTEDGRGIAGEPTIQWPEGWTEQDGGDIKDLGGGTQLYRINYDNAHFQYWLKRENSDNERATKTARFRVGMLILMMGFEDAYGRMEDSADRDTVDSAIEIVRRMAARGAATVVMSIAETLSQLVNPISVSDPDDD